MSVSLVLTITQDSQNMAANTSKITVRASVKWTNGENKTNCTGFIVVDGEKITFPSKSIGFNTGKTTSGTQQIMSSVNTIQHNSTGKKTVSCSASLDTGSTYGTLTATASKALTTIPQITTLAVANGVIGQQMTIVAVKNNINYVHTITWVCNNDSGFICQNAFEEVFYFTPPEYLAANVPSATSIPILFQCITYDINGNYIGIDQKTVNLTVPDSSAPDVSVSVSDASIAFGNIGAYVQKVSKLKIVVTAIPKLESTIASYEIKVNGLTYTKSSVTTSVLTNYGEQEIVVTVTDSRGKKATNITTINVLAYDPPTIAFIGMNRCDAYGNVTQDGKYGLVTYSHKITSLNNRNTKRVILRYKKSTESTYTSQTLPAVYESNKATYIFPASDDASYNVQIYVEDSFNSVVRNSNVSTGDTILHFRSNGLGLAIGKIAEIDGLDVGYNALFRQGVQEEIKVLNDQDFNTIDYTGRYYIIDGINRPIGSNNGFLEQFVFGDQKQYRFQRYQQLYENKGWSRIMNDNSWGRWIDDVTESTVDAKIITAKSDIEKEIPEFVVETKTTGAFTIGANSTQGGYSSPKSLSVGKSGYTPIMATYRESTSAKLYCAICRLEGNTIYYAIGNTDSVKKEDMTASFSVLYKKN